MRQVIAALVFSAIVCRPALADDAAKLAAAKAQANESVQALAKGDFDRMADLTHPEVVRMLGGKEKMVAVLQESTKKFKEQGYDILACTVTDATELVSGEGELFTVVPYTLKTKVPGGKLTQATYLLGVSSDYGKTWRFIDGAKLLQPKVRKLIPNLPTTLKLPKREPPQVEKE
jgi:hypothetical protein